MGGYRKNSGRSKCGTYKGIFCSSTYELVWVIYQLEHGLSFTRNNTGFSYSLKDKEYKYYPDFKIEDEFFEIKGYETEKDKQKWAQFPHRLTVLFKKDMLHMFQYVYEKFGKNLVGLYEEKKFNKCKNCSTNCLKQYCSQECSNEYKACNFYYITDGIKNKRVDKLEIENWIALGWHKGKILTERALININKANEKRKIKKYCKVCGNERKRSKFYCSKECMFKDPDYLKKIKNGAVV